MALIFMHATECMHGYCWNYKVPEHRSAFTLLGGGYVHVALTWHDRTKYGGPFLLANEEVD